jgi:SWIM/SEC-C metal-binding protein
MARLGSKRRPVVVRVQTREKAQEAFALCQEFGLHCIVGVEPGKPEDLSDLERALEPPTYVADQKKIGRNEPCPCGSGKKYKKCCQALALPKRAAKAVSG